MQQETATQQKRRPAISVVETPREQRQRQSKRLRSIHLAVNAY